MLTCLLHHRILLTAIQGFDIDNTAAYQAIEDSKALHARRWQTKEGMYRIKRQALPDVRDAPLHDDNAAASCSDVKPRWRSWDGETVLWDISVIPNEQDKGYRGGPSQRSQISLHIPTPKLGPSLPPHNMSTVKSTAPTGQPSSPKSLASLLALALASALARALERPTRNMAARTPFCVVESILRDWPNQKLSLAPGSSDSDTTT